GTIIASKNDDPGTTIDLVTDSPFLRRPYTHFLCSDDQQRLIGYEGTWSDPDTIRSKLRAGYPPASTVAGQTMFGAFDLSHNGSYLAFVESSGYRLCVARWGQTAECIDEGSIELRISVSDTGAVLYSHGTENTCGDTQCIGLSTWHPGLKRPERLAV